MTRRTACGDRRAATSAATSALLLAVVLAGCSSPAPSAPPGPSAPSGPTTATGSPSTGAPPDPTTSAAPYAAVVRGARPVAYWRLDETTGPTARDTAPAGRFDARFAGGVVTGEPPAVTGPGTSVRLDGTTAFVDVVAAQEPQAAVLAPKDELSVELWFRAAAASADPGSATGRVLLARWRWYGWGLAVDGGRLTASVWERPPGGQPAETTLVGPQVEEGWHHVVLSRDATSSRLFVDGVPVDDGAATGPLFSLAVPRADDCCGTGGGVALGRDGDSAAGYFAGWLDEVAVYDRALTAAEVADHFSYAAG